MSTPSAPDPLPQIKEALFRGEKITAIKLFRESTNCELVDAKNAVEKLEVELRAQHPEKFSAAASKKGCLGILIAGGSLALTAVLLIWFLRA